MRIILLMALFIATSINVKASTILCTHPQACNLVAEHFKDSKTFKFELGVKTDVDPHHYELSPKEVKKLITAKYLITAPINFQPWLKPILSKRSADKSKITIKLSLSDNSKNKKYKYQRSHFWLYPNEICHNLNSTFKQVKNLKLEGLMPTPIKCNEGVERNLNNVLSKLNNQNLVLTHDALTDLFRTNGVSYLALKSSHHHDSIEVKTLKKLQRLQKKKQSLTWILEKGIHVPKNILNKKRKTDKVVNLDITGKLGTSIYQVLEDISKGLNNER